MLCPCKYCEVLVERYVSHCRPNYFICQECMKRNAKHRYKYIKKAERQKNEAL